MEIEIAKFSWRIPKINFFGGNKNVYELLTKLPEKRWKEILRRANFREKYIDLTFDWLPEYLSFHIENNLGVEFFNRLVEEKNKSVLEIYLEELISTIRICESTWLWQKLIPKTGICRYPENWDVVREKYKIKIYGYYF